MKDKLADALGLIIAVVSVLTFGFAAGFLWWVAIGAVLKAYEPSHYVGALLFALMGCWWATKFRKALWMLRDEWLLFRRH